MVRVMARMEEMAMRRKVVVCQKWGLTMMAMVAGFGVIFPSPFWAWIENWYSPGGSDS